MPAVLKLLSTPRAPPRRARPASPRLAAARRRPPPPNYSRTGGAAGEGEQEQRHAMAAPAATAAAHTEESLRRLSAAPGNRVLAWAEPGERRADALSAEQVEALIGRLQGEVVDTVASRPGMNELMLRMELGGRRVGPPAPENYTWADFAAYYPTFWGKITSASATRSALSAPRR